MVDYNPVNESPFPANDMQRGAERRVYDKDNPPGVTVEDSDKFTSGNRPSALDDPRLQELIREQRQARESGDLLDLMKIAGMTGRGSGLTRQDLVDAGLLDSPAESRAKRKKAELEALQELRDQRAEYNKKGKERVEERRKEAQKKRDAKKDRLIERMTDAGVSEEDIEKYRSGGQTSTFAIRRLQEARKKKRGEAAQATKDDGVPEMLRRPDPDAASPNLIERPPMSSAEVEELVDPKPSAPGRSAPGNRTPENDPIVRDRPTGMGFDDMLSLAEQMLERNRKFEEDRIRRNATRDEQIALDLAARKREIDNDYLLGMDYDDYISGDGPGTYIGDYKMSPAYRQYERDMLEHQRKIREGGFSPEDSFFGGQASGADISRAEAAMERARPKPPPIPPAPSFADFKAGKVDGFEAGVPSFLDEDGDGIDDRIAALEKENKKMKQLERLKRLEKQNRDLKRDGGMQPQGTGTGPMPQSPQPQPQPQPQMPPQQSNPAGRPGPM